MNGGRDYLLVINGSRKDEKIYLTKLPVTIGRSDSVDISISQASLSRNHARIIRTDSGYIIEDLNSTNGTFVNDQRISALTPIFDGDRLRLGTEIEIQLKVEPPQENATIAIGMPETGGKTMMMDMPLSQPEIPPQLVVTSYGQESKVYSLTALRVRLGRADDNDIVIENPFVSRYHAELEKRDQDYYLIPSPRISNTLLLDGEPVMEPTLLRAGAKIRVGGFDPRETVVLDYLMAEGGPEFTSQKTIKFTDNTKMTIGRDVGNDIVLPAPTISRFHAEVEKIGQRYRVRDLRSSNGTFVNGKRIDGEVWVHSGDAIQIGPYRFKVADNALSKSDATESGVQLKVMGLNKWVSKKLNILQDISLVFQPKEFIVVVGQSGGGKSTLVDAIAGYRPATHGQVVVNNSIDMYKEFDAIRSIIGYVPQKDIIHMELTVFQALDYAAQLRMPADTTREERVQRVEEVLQDLDLAHRKDTQISKLSGGQQKRVSIGVELLTKPGLFFLDEPTSGLDPGMETELMQLMRRLADQGRTIIMITHSTKNVLLADKVVFLARGGYLTWFGPPEEAQAYFDDFRTERDQRSSPMEFNYIYNLLDQESLGTGEDWADRFKANEAYQKYIAEPLKDGSQAPWKEKSESGVKTLAKRNQVSAARQFRILSSRYMKIISRDRFSLALLILTAPLMASLDFVLASGVGRNPFGFKGGSFNDILITMIVLSNTAILVGGLAFMRELVKEREIYKRERMVNLYLSSYMMSKLWFALVLAIYQAACFTLIRYLAFDMPGGTQEIIYFYITIFLLVFSGMNLGLFASALAPNANAAPLLLILFIIPQMVLSGALVPLPSAVTAPASSRWAFQSVIAISGAGSDVAADACWAKTKEERDAMTLDEKNAQCTCMGENALRSTSCNFPGLGEYYTAAIDQADPIKPAEPGPQPAEPKLPSAPAQPANPNDLQSLQLYLQQLNGYNKEVSTIQDGYKTDLNTWQQSQVDYKDQLTTYQKDLTDLEVKRAIAVGSAEATIARYKNDYGWTFVNKNDSKSYPVVLYKTWSALLLISVILFIGTVLLQKKRESL